MEETFIRQLEGDENLDIYRKEYVKTIQAAKKSKENQERLRIKCRELKAKIASNSVKLDTALKLTEDDDESLLSALREVP